jgi:hypothetical protein
VFRYANRVGINVGGKPHEVDMRYLDLLQVQMVSWWKALGVTGLVVN